MSPSEPPPTPPDDRPRVVRRRRRSFHWTGVAPWLLVAVLAHCGVFLTLWVWRPLVGPPAEPFQVVTVGALENPYLVAERPEPSPAPSAPALPDPPADVEEPAAPVSTADSHSPRAVDVAPENPEETAPSQPQVVGVEDGAPDPFAHRRGDARQAALEAFGGSRATEEAVANGLRWLAAHQGSNGAWARVHFGDLCPELDRCGGRATNATDLDAGPGIAGLVLLALLGAGNTHEQGAYQPTVTLGLHYLLAGQDARGSFARSNSLEMYNHAIATIAVAEAYAMTGDAALKQPLEAAAGHLVEAQQASGGWDYTSDATTGRGDMSVTGWVVMAIKNLDAVGFTVPDATLLGVADFTIRMTGEDGYVAYARSPVGETIDNAGESSARRFGPATTAIGAFIEIALGWRHDTPVLSRQRDILESEPPDLAAYHGGDPSGLHSPYYWYYGTLTLFHLQGADWEGWNRALSPTLVGAQDRSVDGRGVERHVAGSWAPYGRRWGKWGRTGGRVYTTALSVLMLESYYRHTPGFLSSRGLLTERALRAGMADPETAGRHTVLVAATNLSAEVGEPVLVDTLDDPDGRLRLRAAIGLTHHGSPLGRGVLIAAMRFGTGAERAAIEDAVRRIDALRLPDRYGGVLRVDPVTGTVVFDTDGGHTYQGLLVDIERDGRHIATVRVTRRWPARALAAGIIVNQVDASTAVGRDDAVTAHAP